MIHIIRHTDTVASSGTVKGQDEYEISEKGEEILDRLNQNLRSIDISPDKIVCSDLNRAVHTAERIHNLYDGDPSLEKRRDLREIDFGDITSSTEIDEFNKSLGDMGKDERYKSPFPNGESTYDVCQRVRRIYKEIDKDKDNIIVTHMTPILCILSKVRDCHVYDVDDDITHCICISITEEGEIENIHTASD